MRFLSTIALVFGLNLTLAAHAATPVTTRVSVDSNGIEGNDDSDLASMSLDGRYVAFRSNASNLVPGDTNGTKDIFVHDRQTGQTTRVSVDSNGDQANNVSGYYTPAISADGRYVAFDSTASNLVPGDTNNNIDVFVHDRQTGQTARVDVDSNGNQVASASEPAISADGRYVVFDSHATNLVSGDTNLAPDVFVHDRQTGQTTRVNVDSNGNQGNQVGLYADNHYSSISADGRYVAFCTAASNLVPGDTNGGSLTADAFVHDRQTGRTTRVSVDSNGNQANGKSYFTLISADGRYVAFGSHASNLVPGDTNGTMDAFVHDRQTGQTTRVSVDSSGYQGNGESYSSYISADGRYVAFNSTASNLAPGDTNGKTDFFARGPLFDTPANTWTPPAPKGWIHTVPMSGPPGTTFTLSGNGFTPNSNVTAHFRDPQGQELPTVQLTTDAQGDLSFTSTPLADAPLGTYSWWVVDHTTGGMSEKLGYLITNLPGVQTPVGQATTTPLESVFRQNLYGTLSGEGTFDPEKETFVIVHGWNFPGGSTDLPPWMHDMGNDINAKGINVHYWNWQEMARTKFSDRIWNNTTDPSCVDISVPVGLIFPRGEITDPTRLIEIPYDETKHSGQFLAAALNAALKGYPSYNQKIHFVGHSLGTLVSTYALQYAEEREYAYADLIEHLVYLDSPCYFGVPGGNFLHDLKQRRVQQGGTLFWENYMSQVGRPYKDADVDVWLQEKATINPLDLFTAHAYAHEWYRSSVTDFSHQEILGDSSTPSSPMAYGFYWWQPTHRLGLTSDYSQMKLWPHYLLSPGTTWDNTKELVNAIIDATATYVVEASIAMKEQMEQKAKETKKIATIVAHKAYTTAADGASYVVSTAGHAVHDALGFLRLKHSSTATLDMPVSVPAGANVLTFGLEFLYGESGSMVEVFVNGNFIQHVTSDLALGQGLKMMPWINVADYAGQTITLSLRISNPNDGTQGEVRIDDLILAKMEDPPVLASDINNDGAVNIIDTILGLQIASGQEANVKLYLQADADSDNKLGLPEAVQSLQQAASQQ